MPEKALMEAHRVHNNLKSLEDTYKAIDKTDRFSIFFEFSESARETMLLKNETDFIIYTLGMAKKKLPELVFLIGPGKYCTEMSC